MSDNNSLLRSTVARQAAGIFSFQFTETLEVGGRRADACIGQVDEVDKLQIEGRDKLRSTNASVQTSQIANAKFSNGDHVILNGDKGWQIFRFFISPDGAVTTFVLMDGD